MNYTVLQLAKLAGVSSRTLRYYDQIGLLSPARQSESGYRIYGKREVDLLQQILFYKRLGFDLPTVKKIVTSPDFKSLNALRQHLASLEEQERHIRLLIETVKNTIQKEEGKLQMTDKEKFIGLKKAAVDENEKNYGQEIRQNYGDEAVDKSNRKILDLSEEEYGSMQELETNIKEKLAEAVTSGLPATGPAGAEITDMHRRWLSYTWTDYSAKAHKGLADMYLCDERFKQYYDNETGGCAKFLHDAIHSHAK